MQTTENKPVFLGVDVSKDELVAGFFRGKAWQKFKVANDCEAIGRWLDGLEVKEPHFVLEFTGTYSDRLIHCLCQRGLKLSVVNPAQSSAMSKVLQKTSKTDDQDARTLSLLGEKMDTKLYKMPDKTHQKRKEAFAAMAALQKQEQQLKNQLHALSYKVSPNEVVTKSFQAVLDTVQAAVAELQKEVKPQADEEDERRLIARIETIDGVGPVTAQAVVALFGDLSQFNSAKAFAKFIGICPSEFTSGTSVRGRAKITRRGNGKIRGLLFNCARSALGCKSVCQKHYQKLVDKGKNGKSALTAEMHKIARLIYGVARSGQDYDPDFALLKQKCH